MKTNPDYKTGRRRFGKVKRTIYEDNNPSPCEEAWLNTTLEAGAAVIVRNLARQNGSFEEFYISSMVFGNGGTEGGNRKSINSDRKSLFGQVLLEKPVIAVVNPDNSSQAIFTSSLGKEDLVGVPINEAGLKMANGELYAMTTFADYTKGENMRINYDWNVYFY